VSDSNAPERFDVAVVSSNAAMRISEQGVTALMRFMRTEDYVTNLREIIGENVVEIFGPPGVFAHTVFHEGESTGVSPTFYEMSLKFGSVRYEPGYGPHDQISFGLEFRGCAFDNITQEFLDRMDSILYLRPVVAARPFTELPKRIDPATGMSLSRLSGDGVIEARTGTAVEEIDW
jgi:hypothetical protein